MKEVVGKIEQLTNSRPVAIEELIPYLDERPLTEALLAELGFEKRKSVDVVDDSTYTYYTWNYYNANSPSLYADIDNIIREDSWMVRLTHYDDITESPYWNTYGTVKMLMICLQGDREPISPSGENGD